MKYTVSMKLEADSSQSYFSHNISYKDFSTTKYNHAKDMRNSCSSWESNAPPKKSCFLILYFQY